MITEYLGIIIAALIVVVFMYIFHLKETNKELTRQKQNLQVQVQKEKQTTKVKSFESYQKAKKETIKKEIKEANEKRDINLSIGTHDISF